MGDARSASDTNRARLAALLVRISAGDGEALTRLYEITSAKLFGVCLRVLDDREHAEEALQETFVAVWRRADAFDPQRGAAMTWLMTIARNAAVDRCRQNRRIKARVRP